MDSVTDRTCLGCAMTVVALAVGVAFGGSLGYFVATEVVVSGGNGAPVSIVERALETPNSATQAGTQAERVVVTEESAVIEAVNRTLPAVVTVLNPLGGSGSGFIISEAGYMVTNNHVVEGISEFVVVYAKGGRAPARLIGAAPEFDLAVLQIQGAVPGVVAWGDSSQLPLGAQVIAIGSALGEYRNSVTSGVLSGFNRSIGGLQGLLQTDAAINQGNSGGPLINLAGQVVGINAIVVRGMASNAEGLGFAISSNIARNVVQRIIAGQDVRPPFLGIQYRALNPQLANEMGLSISEGALIDNVVVGSPANAAELQLGDVIVAIAGKSVSDRNPLVSLLFEHAAGDTITVDILRGNTTVQTQLTLAER